MLIFLLLKIKNTQDISLFREHFYSQQTNFLGDHWGTLRNTFRFYLLIFFSPPDELLPISVCTLTLAEDPHSPDTHIRSKIK